MTVPLQTQLFDAFLGSQEGIHSIILPDIFSSGGSQNVYIDKFARVVRINGYAKQNTSAYTTSGGGSACMVRGLIPYRGTGGGSTVRQLLMVFDDQVNEWEIWYSTDNGATGTLLYDAGAGYVGRIPDAAQFADKVYITNGKSVPRVYDGTTMSAVGLTQSPTITAAASSTSGNLKGNYLYKLVSTIAGIRQNGSAASTNLLRVDNQASLSWTADTNTNVDGYEIYRTTGTGTTYYYLTTISGRTTVSYTDNISDTLLLEQRILEEHGDAPPTCYYVEPHKQRMWWLGTDANPTRGYWSDAGAPESVYASNFLDFSDSETVGDVITGGLGNYEGLFVVFTEKAIWTVSGTGAVIGDTVDWAKTRTNASIGAVIGRAAVRVPAGSKFTDQTGQTQTTSVSSIAYFTPLGDIRVFDGENDIIVSHPVRTTVAGFAFASRTKIHAVVDTTNDQAIWFIPTGSSTEPDTAVAWNYRFGVWYVWKTLPFGASVQYDTSTVAALLLVGETNVSKGGYVYKLFSGDTFDGSNIDARWMTKTLYGHTEQNTPAFTNRKRWRWIDVLFRIDASVSITVEWLPGKATDTAAALGSVTVTPASSTLVSSVSSTILSAGGSSILTATSSAQKKAFLASSTGDYLYDEGIRLRVGTNGSAAAWALEALQLAYQILPGLKRRDQA